jgi:hypothetical protein
VLSLGQYIEIVIHLARESSKAKPVAIKEVSCVWIRLKELDCHVSRRWNFGRLKGFHGLRRKEYLALEKVIFNASIYLKKFVNLKTVDTKTAEDKQAV